MPRDKLNSVRIFKLGTREARKRKKSNEAPFLGRQQTTIHQQRDGNPHHDHIRAQVIDGEDTDTRAVNVHDQRDGRGETTTEVSSQLQRIAAWWSGKGATAGQ